MEEAICLLFAAALIVFSLSAATNVDQSHTPKDWDRATKACTDNGGLKVSFTDYEDQRVVCENGAVFEFQRKES